MVGITVGTRYYERQLGAAPLPRPCANCGRGEGTARQSWMAATMAGIPLVVHGVEVHYRCAWCGTETLGPAPPGAPPIPLHQRLGLVFLIGGALALYGAFLAVTGLNNYLSHRAGQRALAAAPSGPPPVDTVAALSVARTHANAALVAADEARDACRAHLRQANPSGVADAPFWSGAKIDTTASASLASTPYYGFDSLPAERDNASAVGGFACVVPGAKELRDALAAASPSTDDIEARAKSVEVAAAEWHDPPVVVVSHGGCKTDAKWCRVALLWVDVGSKRVSAAATEDFAWREDGNDPGAKAAMEKLRERVRGWKAAR